MALTRRMLKELGLEDESIEKIMTEHGKVMEGMITKSQAEDERNKAVETAKTEWEQNHKPVEVKETDAYKDLEKKYSELQLSVNLKDARVKDKYRDFVIAKLDKDKPFDEGIKAIREQYEEFFDMETKDQPKEEDPKPKPQIIVPEKKPDGEPTEAEKVKAQFLKGWR